ncbi:ImmA/IrrE family metallo-endopeptidase [Sphaerochaeta sp. S2]|uniref:ImmA/IrrE family metallo-endopeptidase n=1 Tax=Sphaerochaeta sp. S2 TaxID=2798868 RepID=UPI0018E952E5|nr:ImmA/IrrE family metallo-endopeptidase [Sphaerochaeta sp. S2]MBJ2357317.1 ImmA/IrrE family metallo-endopeptidase [Sphaerochaeta sp. S2]
MNRKIKLSIQDIESIRELARNKRFELGFSDDPPIANDIQTILDKLEIILLEIPVEAEGNKPSFSAALLYSEEGGECLVFIGLNTADYFDKQVFAIAHELYHFFTKTGSHLSRQDDQEEDVVEAKANWFAAEFLLPEEVLKRRVFEEFKSFSLADVQQKVLLRFIARLHCTWWLPYRSLVKRLWEIKAIRDEQYKELYGVDERDSEGEYGRVGRSTQSDVFLKLNTATKTVGSSPRAIETILRNFEDNLIDEDTFVRLLGRFKKSPSDYGYEISISQDDMDEMHDFIEGRNHDG